MVSTTITAALSGLDGFPVVVESFSEKGALPTIEIIGLPDASVKEALERIHAACSSNGLPFYKGRTTVNLAPADAFYPQGGTDRLLADIGLTPEPICQAVLTCLKEVPE